MIGCRLAMGLSDSAIGTFQTGHLPAVSGVLLLLSFCQGRLESGGTTIAQCRL